MDIYEQKIRELLADMVRNGQPISDRYLPLLFPSAANLKGEYELVYKGKLPINMVDAQTLAAPLQRVREFPAVGAD